MHDKYMDEKTQSAHMTQSQLCVPCYFKISPRTMLKWKLVKLMQLLELGRPDTQDLCDQNIEVFKVDFYQVSNTYLLAAEAEANMTSSNALHSDC